MDDAVFEKFRKIAAGVLSVPIEKITREAKFADDLDADSLDLVELVMAVEEEFNITDIPEAELETVETIGQVLDILATKL